MSSPVTAVDNRSMEEARSNTDAAMDSKTNNDSAVTVADGSIVDGKILLSTDLCETSLVMPDRQDGSEVDKRDADTPDNWIKRHPAMVRLTG
ncbi:unnamed protein product, partial [Polarella glacialis]